MVETVRVEGLAELNRALNQLAKDMREKAARGAAAAGASVIRGEAKRRAESMGLKRTGAIIKNIAIKREKGTGDDIFEYHIGVRHGIKKQIEAGRKFGYSKIAKRMKEAYPDDPFYWWYWEFGHYNPVLRRRVPPVPFMRTAFEAKRGAAIQVVKERLIRQLKKVSGYQP